MTRATRKVQRAFAGKATLSGVRGNVRMPKRAQESLGLRTGTEFLVWIEGDSVVYEPIRVER